MSKKLKRIDYHVTTAGLMLRHVSLPAGGTPKLEQKRREAEAFLMAAAVALDELDSLLRAHWVRGGNGPEAADDTTFRAL